MAVLRALQLGDLLCAVPCFRAMRQAWPDATVTLVGLPWAKNFVARFARYLDRFEEFPGLDGLPERPFDPSQMQKFEAARSSFDVAIQLHGDGSVSNRFLPKLRARMTAGFFPAGDKPCPDPARFIPYPENEHEIRRLLQLICHLGIPLAGEGLEFPLTHSDFHEANQVANENGLRPGNFVCLHVGARDPKRRWPLENFVQVAETMATRGLRMALTGTVEEADQTAVLQSRLGVSCVDLTGKTSLGGLAALLKQARLLICNDTGLSHLAAALEVPSVVVFSASDPRRWAPLDRDRHRALGDPVASPAVRATPREVLHQAFALLEKSPLRWEVRGGGFPVLPPVQWDRMKRVLLVHAGPESDVVLLGRCAAALRSGSTALALLTCPAGAPLAPLFPGIDRVLVANGGTLIEPVAEGAVRALVDDLRAGAFDAAIIFTEPGQSPYTAAYICYLAGIPVRIGASTEFGGVLLTHWVRKLPEGLHPEERHLALLRAVGLPLVQEAPGLAVPPVVLARVQAELREAGVDSAEGCVLLDDITVHRHHVPLVAQRLRSVTGKKVLRSARFRSASAVDLAALIQLSDLIITWDPVTSRLADAFSRPLVAMGPAASRSAGWRPRRSLAKLLTDPAADQNDVLQAVRTLLWASKSRGHESEVRRQDENRKSHSAGFSF